MQPVVLRPRFVYRVAEGAVHVFKFFYAREELIDAREQGVRALPHAGRLRSARRRVE